MERPADPQSANSHTSNTSKRTAANASIKRDGALATVWQDADRQSPVKMHSLPGALATQWDVVIVGAGITGLTTGLQLQEAGKRCLILEAYTIGFGTTGGTTAHINTLLDTPYHTIEKDFGAENAQLVAQATHVARDLIASNVAAYGIDCDFAYKEGYLFAQTEQEEAELQQIYDATVRAGVEVDGATDIPVPLAFRRSLRFRKQAQIHPIRYLDGLARAFQDAGGAILTGIKVTSARREDHVHHVETYAGVFRTSHLVYATHIPPGVNLLHFRCAPYRSYVLAARLSNQRYPADLAYDMKQPYHYFRTAGINGQQYLLLGGADHKTGHGDPAGSFRDLEAFLRKYYQVDSVDYRWSSQFFEPADGLPYIGKLPGAADETYVATGYSGNGITYGSFAGQLLRDLILGRETPFEKLFSPLRVKPVAAFSNFVKENAAVVYRFVADRLDISKMQELVELVPGTGTVVRMEGKKVAVYKSESGAIQLLDPRCTHAGCIVGWNNAEKSWDRPCHGGRYDIAGKVITGPPRKDLATVLLGDKLMGGGTA